MRIARVIFCSFAVLLGSTGVFAKPARLSETGRIPVLAWPGVPQQETSEARYREMGDCGFTIGFSSFANVAEARKAMDAARAAGVGVLVSCPQLASNPEETARQLMDHPGLAGYFIRDEPPVSEFAAEAKWIATIRSVDPGHLIYGNLLPDYATPEQLGVPTYPEYVDRYVADVKTTFLSFDYYPIVGTAVRPSWYSNLGVVADAARKANKPFWAFALSLRHFAYPTATRENLRLEVFSDLAYGAQGIQYFTYWQPGFESGDSPIDSKGNRTLVYDRVKEMNAEIRALSPVFLGSRVESIGHTGAHRPAATTPYRPASPVTSLETEGDGAIVSLLARDKHRFLVIVNRDFQHPMPTTIEFAHDAKVQRVEKDASVQPLKTQRQSLAVDPGDCVIFTWDSH